MGDALHTHGGVVDAREARFAQAGLLAVQGPTLLDARTGVLVGPGATALVTGTAATAPMAVAVAPHQWLTSRGAANGPYLGALEAATTVPIAAAPASGTRTDVVYVKQGDATPGVPTPDATTAPLYAAVTGTVGAGKPALPVGAEELATVAVTAGATATNGANIVITNTARQAVARGANVPVRNQAERDALTGYLGLRVVRLDLTGAPEERWVATNTWIREGRGPVVLGPDTGTSGVTAAPGPVTMHPGRTIDPGAIFGPGVGAVVTIQAQTLGDCTGQWDLQIVSPALSATILRSDSRGFAGRNTLMVTDTVTIPPGSSMTFSTRLANGVGSITTYGDPVNNQAKYVVHPYVP